MAYITLDAKKLKANFDYLDSIFSSNNINWTVVSKILSGNRTYLQTLLDLGIKQVADSRITNLKMIKAIHPDIETMYIKPPAKRAIPSVVKYADISMNTEFETIRLLSEEAEKQQKRHKIIIMIELGELREGVMGDELIDFYASVFQMKYIEVVGIGTNLTCMNGILPDQDKLIQLSLYKQLIEARFNKKIPYVSGGSSVTIPLIFNKLLPKGINHFRVGESLFLGTDVYNDEPMKELNSDVFKLYAEIIELNEKPLVPSGQMGTNTEGEEYTFSEKDVGQNSYRAILDLGLLDVDKDHISPVDKDLKYLGASSDMFVVDLGENMKEYSVGDVIEFRMDYMGTLRVVNSKYIDKRVR
ncbi:MAG: alanine/ornithine racemase family PLP-dependent enzyme [Bacteroidales bacterium]|jgi:predicted amino acid racemase|nr:alanine/ornithine racemase family PLP-dependent enzyme [Bacteroidales bacterium]